MNENVVLDLNSAEQAYRAYKKAKTVDSLIAWFKAELALQPTDQQMKYRDYSDAVMRNHTRQVEELACAFRQDRQPKTKAQVA